MTNTNEAVLRAIYDATDEIQTYVGFNRFCDEWDAMMSAQRAALAATATVAKDGGGSDAEFLKIISEIGDAVQSQLPFHPCYSVREARRANSVANILINIESLGRYAKEVATPKPEASAEQPAGEVTAMDRLGDITHQLVNVCADLHREKAASKLPDGWVALSIIFNEETDYPEEVAYGPAAMMARLGKKLDKYYADVIDKRDAAPISEDTMTPRELAKRVVAGEKWKLADEPISEDTGKAPERSGKTADDSAIKADYSEYLKWCVANGKDSMLFSHFKMHSIEHDAPADSSSAAPSNARELFEEWMREECGADDVSLGRRACGNYNWGRTCDMWSAYSKALAAPSPTGDSLSARDAALEEAAKLLDGQRFMTLRPTDPCAEARVQAMKSSRDHMAKAIRALKTVPGEPT